jgi:soluble lytic murein transglycosylase
MEQRTKYIAAVVVPLVLLATITILTYGNASADNKAEKSDAVQTVVEYLKGKKVDMREDKLKNMVHSVYNESQQVDLDYRLALAVIEVESDFRHDVVSTKGARGLFQIKPSLAKYIAKDAGVKYSGDDCLHEPEKNIRLGVYHLSKLVETFKNLPTALHAYNVGESKLRGRGAKDEPKTAFTKKVMKKYETNLRVLPDADGLEE